MLKLNARDIAKMERKEVLGLPQVRCIIVFDDGEIETTTKHVILSWFLWGTYVTYPNRPLEIRHFIGNGVFDTSSVSKVMTQMFRSLYIAYGPGNYDEEAYWKQCAVIYNEITNFCSLNLEAWIRTTSIEDYDDLYRHPQVAEAKANMRPTQESIKETYETFKRTVFNDESLEQHNLVRAMLTKTQKIDSVQQNLISRGFMTEINSNTFPTPIVNSYYEGITDLGDSLIESRGGAKAAVYVTSPLEMSEYFSRRVRISTSSVMDIHRGDCGSNTGIRLILDDHRLKGLHGRYYFDEQGKTDKFIDHYEPKSYEHLMGKEIVIRSPLECKLRGDGTVCSKCMGAIAYNIPLGTNIGWVSATVFSSSTAQLVMSVKHYDSSSSVVAYTPDLDTQKYFRRGKCPNSIALVSPKRGYVHSLYLPLPAPRDKVIGAKNLIDLGKYVDVGLLRTSRLTEFSTIDLSWNDGRVSDQMAEREYGLDVTQDNRNSSASPELVQYIVDHGYTLTTDNKILVKLDKWNYEDPIMNLPPRNVNVIDYVQNLEKFFMSRGDANTDRLINYKDISHALTRFIDVVDGNVDIDSHHLEILLLSLSKSATDPDDWRIPEYGKPMRLERHARIVSQRSASGLLAYEKQRYDFQDEVTFRKTGRPRHMFDPLIIQ